MTRRALGRGLEALIPTRPAAVESPPTLRDEDETLAPHEVEVDRIQPNRYQPRQRFDAAKLQELADSVRENGVLQPLLVTRRGEGFELIAGERRLRAAPGVPNSGLQPAVWSPVSGRWVSPGSSAERAMGDLV